MSLMEPLQSVGMQHVERELLLEHLDISIFCESIEKCDLI